MKISKMHNEIIRCLSSSLYIKMVTKSGWKRKIRHLAHMTKKMGPQQLRDADWRLLA